MGYLQFLTTVVTMVTFSTAFPASTSPCGGPLTGDTGSFSSPVGLKDPNLYLTNVTCTWRIKLPRDSWLTVNFTKFKTEGCCDHVKILTADGKLIGQFGGVIVPDPVVVSSDEAKGVTIVFRSDLTVAKEGFTARYIIKRKNAPFTKPSSAPLHGLDLVSAFQTLTLSLTEIIQSSTDNLVAKNFTRKRHLIASINAFKRDLSVALAQLAKLRSVTSNKLSDAERKQINFALKHLNLKAKHHRIILSGQVAPPECLQKKVPGICRGYFPRWYYNPTKMICERFIYGGCKGNDNRFDSRHECEALCKPALPTTMPTTRASTTPMTQDPSTMCPPGVPICYNIISPCDSDSCDAYVTTTCKANHCGTCSAMFSDQHGNRISDEACRCLIPVQCVADPCQISSCPMHPKAKCRARVCGACTAEFVDDKGKVITDCLANQDTTTKAPPTTIATKDPSTMCPPGVPICYSAISPCDSDSCDAYVTTTCKANYCGTCSAMFSDQHGNRISPEACRCLIPVGCVADPCQISSCPMHPKAKCRARVCGACTAEFVDDRGKVITDCLANQDTTTKAPPTTIATQDPPCPNGVPRCRNIVRPCDSELCNAYVTTTCKDNRCTCRAMFADQHGNRISEEACRCLIPVGCVGDPCQVSTCQKHPKAKCRARVCGACTAEFVDDKGNVITDC